jgi:hypothetical protein
MAKIEPAVTQLCYALANGDNYIDVAKDLSVYNRRLYRQGKVYAVQNIQIYFDGADSGANDTSQQVRSIQVATIPNTWIVHNAWSKGFRCWQKQQREYLAELNCVDGQTDIGRPKWADFKIGMDAAHIALDSGSGDQDISIDARAGDFSTTVTPDEWLISKFHWDNNGTEQSPLIHMLGEVNANNVSYVGLVENYGDSRVRVETTSPALSTASDGSIYALMHHTDDMAEAIGNDIEATNDAPPYDADAYVGGAAIATVSHPVAYATANVINPVGNTGGMIAPCGLLKIHVDAWHDADPGAPGTDLTDLSVSVTKCIVTLVPGPYRGVMASGMGQ